MFALNGNIFDPNVKGIEEIFSTYEQAIKNATLCGPTLFGPIIKQITQIAQAENVNQQN